MLFTVMDQIKFTGMRFHGRHGCLEFERKRGQTFVVDVTLGLDLQTAGRTDELRDTVNYAEVFEVVREVVVGEPMNLIEAVAERIAAQLLAGFPRLAEVGVEVHKPNAPIDGDFDCVSVVIRRSRQ